MDMSSWLRLRGNADARWRAFATGEAQPPLVRRSSCTSRSVFAFLGSRSRRRAVSILEPARGGEARTGEVRSNKDGLFDVTDLGLV
jgi:hypothetical protein